MTTQENILARYKVLHELGRGATGAVYAARDRETGEAVALKRLDPAVVGKSDASFAGRFLKQARSARLLKHRNIVKVHDAGEAGGTVYVAMEMLEGQNLRRMLDAGAVPIARAIQIVHDIASGLAHAHLEGVVHGALKPSNVIVLRSGVVKITDFGIGQAAMSPEQLRGGPVDHRCDLFSLGALFYEMLVHRPPFEGGSSKEILENILHARPPLPSEVNPHVPRALDAIVSSMLAGEPAARMPGAPILLRELQRLEEGLGLGSGASAGNDGPAASVPPARPEPAPPTPDASGFPVRADSDIHKAMAMMEREFRPERSSGSRPAIFAAALVLAVLGLGLTGFMYYSATAQGVSRPTTPAPDAPEAPAVEPGPLAQTESLVAHASEEPAPAGVAPAQEPPRAMQPAEKVPEKQPGGRAQVIVAVSPRGEIFIDGKHYGTTPPITTLDLEPGMHRIEVRSGSRKPYLTYMTVQAGDVRRIRHDFDASRAVHPPASASWQNGERRAR